MNRLAPRLKPAHERQRGQKPTGYQDLETSDAGPFTGYLRDGIRFC